MTTLISLVGEQVIPNLLPYKYLKPDKNILFYSVTTEGELRKLERLMHNVEKVKVDAYDFSLIYKKVKEKISNDEKLIFNLTGGTKIMSIVLFLTAYESKSESIYFKSEGNISQLYRYKISNGRIEYKKENLPELIDIDTFLKAHVFDYHIKNKSNSGSDYENTIAKIIEKQGFDILQNVIPVGEGNQLEIDLVIKKKNTNNFAIVEIKVGDKEEKGPKKGIDQLGLAGQREYLGIYTKRILITSRPISKQLRELAKVHKVIVIDEIEIDRNGNVTKEAERKLIQFINEKFS